MTNSVGTLEVIAGPMFSGKTEELIRRVQRAVIGKKKVQVFKHAIDTRYGKDNKIFSHNGKSFTSIVIQSSKDILKNLNKKTEIVAIDEAQWFGDTLINVINALLTKNKKVIVAGLALTFNRTPFPPIPTLMALADTITKLTAVCTICGKEAIFHKRIINGISADPTKADQIFVGQTESYQARCRNCFDKP